MNDETNDLLKDINDRADGIDLSLKEISYFLDCQLGSVRRIEAQSRSIMYSSGFIALLLFVITVHLVFF